MRRAISIVPAVLAVVGALVLLMGQANSVFSGNPANCHDRILGKLGVDSPRTYNCPTEIEGGGTDGMKLEFSSTLAGPEDLDVLVNDSVTGKCACIKKGKKLEKSAKFRCIMDNFSIGDNTSVGDFEVLGSTIEGRSNKAGTKITRGQGVDEFGVSIIYHCEEAP